MARPPKARAPLKQAALELFVDQGVHATGIRDIAKHAGCSEAALYRHWKNKDDLVVSLFTEHLGEVRTILEDAIASAPTLEAKVRAASAACYRLYDEQPQVFRFVLLVQHELARTLPGDLKMPQDVIAELAKEAIKRNDGKGDPIQLAAAVIGIFLETAVFVLYGRLAGPLSRYSDAVAEAALRVLAIPKK
jgi:AcrR family transcriptional regulator